MTAIHELEEAAFAAWPAEEVADLDGWRLRAMRGVTRRANSVWPNRCEGPASLDERIAAAEAFYRQRGLEALFQIGPLACPAGLDDALASRGYATEARVSIQTAPVDTVTARAASERFRVEVTTSAPAELIDLLGRRGRYASSLDVFEGLLGRLGSRAGYGVAWEGAEPVSAGLVVVQGHWAGLFAMRTLEQCRGRGAGRALLGGLVAHGRGRGARSAYLQVERDNPAALALYARAGFRELYGQHYRRGQPPSAVLPASPLPVSEG